MIHQRHDALRQGGEAGRGVGLGHGEGSLAHFPPQTGGAVRQLEDEVPVEGIFAGREQLHRQGNTVVLITHDNSIAVQADRIIRLEDGQVVYDGDSHAPEAMVQPTLLPETPEKEEQA